MSVALLVYVSAFFSIANGLKDCLSIPSFTLPDQVRGQCQPSKHPGAFYTEELTPFFKFKQSTDDEKWECWDRGHGSDAEAEAMAKSKGFAGACFFAAYVSRTTPEEVPLCSQFLDHNPPDCHPGPEVYWGACVTNMSKKVKCIPKDEEELVSGVAKGDCNFFSVRDDQGHNRYNNVCRFEIDKPLKCPTVPTYIADDKSTCSSQYMDSSHVSEKGQEVYPFRSACFSLATGTLWSCRAEASEESNSCTWTYLNGGMAKMKRMFFGERFYDGLCLFPGSPGYGQAADWPGTASQAPLGIFMILALVLLMFAVAVGGLLYWRRGNGARAVWARQQRLIGDVGGGSEMSAPRDAFETEAPPLGPEMVDTPRRKLAASASIHTLPPGESDGACNQT